MAFTTPASGSEFAVSEIVTAAKLNSKVTDNIRYLKGLDGAVVIDDTLRATQLGVGVAPSASYAAYIKSTNLPSRIEQSSSAVDYINLNNAGAASNQWGIGIRMVAEGDFSIRDVTAAASRLYINASGNVGLGMTAPQGRLHMAGQNLAGGWLCWDFDGVNATPQTLIPDGTNDVVNAIQVFSLTKISTGATFQANATSIAQPGGSLVLFDTGPGTNTCTLSVSAAGAVTVARTAGAATYKVRLLAIWF